MHIQVRINEEGALRNQRYAFTNRFTLVTELLQNARRAGASRIQVDHDASADLLRIRDDGQGLKDFQKLLTLHESGWDTAMVAQERPFGVGFSKCLYAASRCIVESGAQRVDIDTKAALERHPVEVAALASPVAGTLVELHGVGLPDLAIRMETLCQGFPIDVVFNGCELLRPFASDRWAMLPTPIGSVHLCGQAGDIARVQCLVFLQGFCVKAPVYFKPEEVNVVHLDSREFIARLPDRDKLIDEDQQIGRIDTALKTIWRSLLTQAKAALEPADFVASYYATARAWGHLDLLNDLDALPAELFQRIAGYPVQSDGAQDEYLQSMDTPPSRAEIESGQIAVIVLDSVNDDNAACWMLARSKGWLVFTPYGLHQEHWLQAHVRYLDELATSVEPLEAQCTTELDGRWVGPTVTLCRAVRITLGDEFADVDDAGVCHESHVYVPAGETSGEPVRQLSSFTDSNDQYLGGEMEADRDALADLVRRLRCVDPVDTLDSLLHELRLGKYPLLHGKTFEVTVGVGAAPGHSVALRDGEGARNDVAAGTGGCDA